MEGVTLRGSPVGTTSLKNGHISHRASKNTKSSVFYTEIETKILNTDFDKKRPNYNVVTNYSSITSTRRK